MARRYRYEYLQRKKARERALSSLKKAEKLQSVLVQLKAKTV